MKKIRALCLILMLVFSALVFSACGESEKIKKAEKIELSQTSITLQVGEIALIDVKISPVDLLNKEFDVIGGNDDVATIDIDLEGMRIVVKAVDYIVDGVADTTIGVRTVDGSYKEEHLNIHVYQDDPSVEMPKNFTFDGRNLVWQTVDDAIGYTVDINGESRVVYTTTFALDLENMAGQTIVAKVKANGASQNLDSPYTSELKFTVLNKPTNVKYNDATQILSWDEVENATSYAVFVNNRLIYCEETQLEILDEIPANFECKLKVRANGNTSKTYINSSFSDVITLKKLGSPLNLTIENRKVTWSTIGGAIAYDVLCSYKKNGEDVEDIVRVRNTTYTLPFDIDAGVGEVKVRAIGDGKSSMTSDYTLVKKFTKLSSVRNLRVEDGIIYWDSVEFATNYTIILENVIDDEGNTETISYSQTGSSSILSYNIEKYQAGSYQVNIQANGSIDSISSNPLSRPLVVTKLAVPTGLQATKVDGVCKIKWQNDPKATGYVIYLKNSSTISYNIAKVEGSYVEYSFNGSVMEVGENLISVKALGSLSDSDITYVNSDISADIAVTKLSVPNINMSKIKSGIVSWLGIKNVGSYELIVKDFNGTVLHTYRLSTISIDFNSEEYKLAVGNYQITLRALASQNAEAYGNDDYMAVFDGEVSSTIKICKLPTNYVKVENGTVNDLTPQGNYLYNYLVTFEDGQTSTYASAHEYVENVIRGGERVSIQVQAVSIKEKDETNMYFISSDLSQKLYVRKLPVINDISMENGVIKYGVALENYSGYQFNLVLNETTNILNGTNTLYDFSKVEAGIYSVKIKAISTQSGNGLSQDVNNPLNINGKLGSAFAFEKLAAPDDLQVSSFGSSEYESFRNIMHEIKTYNPLSSGSLVWSEVSKATAYELIFDDDIDSQRKTMTVLDTYESLQNTDITTNIRHSVLIKSLGNGSNIIDSEKSTSYVSFTKFASPDNISLRNGVLTWTYSDNSKNPNKIVDINNPYLKLAIFLIVDTNGNCYSTLSKMVDGKYVKLNIATLTLSELQDALQMNSCPIPTELVQATSLSVIAVPMNIYIKNELLHFDFVEDISKCVISDFTDGINVEPLATPFDLKMENNVISWSPIRSNEALNEYRLFINYGNGSNNYISFKQGTPMVDYTNRVVFVDDIKSAENCTWRFNKQNFELMFGEGDYKAGNYQFKIQAIANNVYYEMNGEYIYYINSDISTAKSIILLANPDIVLNNGRIVWRKVPNVLGYWIFVNTTSHGEDYMELTNSDVNPVDSDLNGYCQLPFGEYYAAGTYYFNAVAIGDGTNTVSSEFSYDSEKEYTKLELKRGII